MDLVIIIGFIMLAAFYSNSTKKTSKKDKTKIKSGDTAFFKRKYSPFSEIKDAGERETLEYEMLKNQEEMFNK